MTTKVTIVQFDVTIGDLEANFEKAQNAIDIAIENGSSLVLFPELWLCGYDLSNAEVHSQATIKYSDRLQSIADQHNLSIGGSYMTTRGGHTFNTFLLHIPGRKDPVEYDKTHLFRLLEENIYFTPGDLLGIADLGWARVGLAICYDIRFPELVRAYAQRNIDCLLVTAEWGMPRLDHWRTLLRARAIENQIFIVASGATGFINSTPLAGSSTIIDPWGRILVEASSNRPEIHTIEIDLEEIKRARLAVPSGTDQRHNLYRQWENENQ